MAFAVDFKKEIKLQINKKREMGLPDYFRSDLQCFQVAILNSLQTIILRHYWCHIFRDICRRTILH